MHYIQKQKMNEDKKRKGMEAGERGVARDVSGGGGGVVAADGGKAEAKTLTANLCPRVQC